jgi:phosphate uptake regulator
MIERIADHAVRLSENVELLLDQSIDTKVVELIEKAVDIGLQVFQNSIEALFLHDIIKANTNIESAKPLDKICTEIMSYTFKQESIMAIPLDNIVESIRRLQQYSRDISENVMNYILVSEDRPFYK